MLAPVSLARKSSRHCAVRALPHGWQELNRAVRTFSGVADSGAGTLVIEAQTLVATGIVS